MGYAVGKENRMKAEIVSNKARQILDMGKFWYIYLPITQTEASMLGFKDKINLAWRIEMPKEKYT